MTVHNKTAIVYFDCIIGETLSKAVFIDISDMYSCIREVPDTDSCVTCSNRQLTVCIHASLKYVETVFLMK